MDFGSEKIMDFTMKHCKARPGRLGGEGDGQDHGVPDFFALLDLPRPSCPFMSKCQNCKVNFQISYLAVKMFMYRSQESLRPCSLIIDAL